MEDNVNIEIRTEDFDKIRSKAIEAGDKLSEDGDEGKYVSLNNLKLDSKPDERYLDIKGNKFIFSGSLLDKDTNDDVGYMSFELAFDAETLVDLISVYMKKLGKVKTVLEAVKDE